MADLNQTRPDLPNVVQQDGQPYPLIVDAPGICSNGATATFQVSLPEPVACTVQATVIGDGSLTVLSGASLTFTALNYSVPQNVVVQSVAGQAGWKCIQFAVRGGPAYFTPVTLDLLVS